MTCAFVGVKHRLHECHGNTLSQNSLFASLARKSCSINLVFMESISRLARVEQSDIGGSHDVRIPLEALLSAAVFASIHRRHQGNKG